MANGSGTTYSDTTIYNQTTDITLYAIWSNTSYTLNYQVNNSEGGRIVGDSQQTVPHGQSGTAVTAVPSLDYIFDKWSDNLTTPKGKTLMLPPIYLLPLILYTILSSVALTSLLMQMVTLMKP